ncbi:hypothetical protein DEA06_14670 [Microbacterium sp. Gd 4-13]|mgnify:CR=1 FL=1|uniref:hypothetical protein n=1 Tax=Microbacterium sp. Gd 4-13 TaxID=2173179 RepID=UPI000D587F5D|nr:hypothetical protein [Microbacterium sp. Gd 4-13]PVW03004.1 hypothetical protein DEA06_14670 [Microbacterium sp. Gd 4-13]
MSDLLDSLRMRREILLAYVTVLDRAEELLRVCAAAIGEATEARLAVEDTFGLSPVAADAVLALQVRRFTPTSLEQIRQELVDVDRQLVEAEIA